MMHQQIEDDEIIERYVRNQLDPEARKAFEEHYFSCDECFQKLQVTERFVAGVRDAGRRGLLAGVGRGAGPVWRIAPTWMPALTASALAALVLALASSAWYYVQQSRLRGELSRSNAELLKTRQARADLEQQLQRASQAEINIPLVVLQSTRDAQAPPTTAILPAAAGRLVLWMEVPAGRFSSYRLEVIDADENPVATLDHLVRNPYGALVASIPTERLQTGEFRIKLFGNPSPATLLAEYQLRIQAR